MTHYEITRQEEDNLTSHKRPTSSRTSPEQIKRIKTLQEFSSEKDYDLESLKSEDEFGSAETEAKLQRQRSMQEARNRRKRVQISKLSKSNMM